MEKEAEIAGRLSLYASYQPLGTQVQNSAPLRCVQVLAFVPFVWKQQGISQPNHAVP